MRSALVASHSRLVASLAAIRSLALPARLTFHHRFRLTLAGCVLSRVLPASLADTVYSLRSVPSVGGFSLWHGFLLLASPLSLHGFCEWLLPWVLSVYLRLFAFFPGSVFILPLGLSSFASPCAPQYRSVSAFGFSCFLIHWFVSSRVLGTCFLSVSCLLDSRVVFFPSLGGLCSRLALPVHSFLWCPWFIYLFS